MCRRAGSRPSRSGAPIRTARSRIPRTPPPSRAPRGKPLAVVVDLKPRTAAGELEPHVGAARLRVARDVGQRLLGDAVEHELGVAAELRQAGLDVDVDLELGVLGDALAEHPQRAGQAEVVERLRPQPARDPAHLLEAVAGGLLRLQDAVAGGSGTSRAARPSCRTTPVSDCPTPSWSSCATRSRSPSCAASARPTLSRRSASRRSSISLNAAASSAASESPPPTSSRRPGSSGSIRRANAVSSRSGASARRSSRRLSGEHQREPAGEDRQLAHGDVLDARREHERGDRARGGEDRGVADGQAPEERGTARASEHGRSV